VAKDVSHLSQVAAFADGKQISVARSTYSSLHVRNSDLRPSPRVDRVGAWVTAPA
jgi:hypothetical protein